MSRRTGRRPGDSGARQAILDAARSSFAVSGYDAATIRGIARDAGVDPALVHHYFGTKQQLFAAALDLPVNPGEIIAGVLAGDPDTVGQRLAHTFLTVWDAEVNRSPMIALVRSATSNDQVAAMVREFLTHEIFAHLTSGLPVTDRELRASMVATQLMGVVLLRYVLGVEPLASQPAASVADMIAPTLQRYLLGDLVAS